MIYPLREENCKTDTTFDRSQWEQVKEYSKQGWKNWLLAAYSLREENFLRMTPQTASLSGNKWREKIFGRTLKNILSHSSHYEDMYLDNWIKSPSSMTVRWPRKSERGDAAVRSRGRHTKGARKSGAYSAISKYLSNYLLLPEKKNIGNCNSFQNR